MLRPLFYDMSAKKCGLPPADGLVSIPNHINKLCVVWRLNSEVELNIFALSGNDLFELLDIIIDLSGPHNV